MWYLGDIGQQTLEMHTADLNNYCAGLQLAYAIDSLMSTERVALFSQKPKQQLLAKNRRNVFGTSDSYCEFGNFFPYYYAGPQNRGCVSVSSDTSHKSQYALNKYIQCTIFKQKMCTPGHSSATKGCIVGNGTGGICVISLQKMPSYRHIYSHDNDKRVWQLILVILP